MAGAGNGNVSVWKDQDGVGDGLGRKSLLPTRVDGPFDAVSLSIDETSFLLVFSHPAGVELRDADLRTSPSSRTERPGLDNVYFAICSENRYTEDGASGSCCRFIVFGENKKKKKLVIEYRLGETLELLSKYMLPSSALSICCVYSTVGNRFVVCCGDGCVRMVEAIGSASIEGAELGKESEPMPERGRLPGPGGSFGNVMCVAVLPLSGRVIAGYRNGDFSLWRTEDGHLDRGFRDGRGYNVRCVDVSDDESVAVSGHENGSVLVWDLATEKHLFAMRGNSSRVVCATTLANKARIVRVDFDGKLRLWDAENGAPLSVINTELKTSCGVSRGAISRDARYFLWAAEDHEILRPRWKVKLVDLSAEHVIFPFEEEFFYWGPC